ncbi:type IV conjugative transfer system protein TraL [uncultured Shewanella sp.]|uniref:type IV conjugative transfer system protein TraL n=1 Tax=uncultured Shewanella sp. TaxID=173975 RepID=UPI00261A06B8|nr:type IV conjugative transfer system protein TraL [uncultured Shewanella sp.]
MDNPTLFFSIPKHLNNQKTLLGFPIDELAPALCIFFILFSAQYAATGFFLAAAWFLSMRKLKSQYGHNALRLALFWYAPNEFSKSFFKVTPSASKRYWLN